MCTFIAGATMHGRARGEEDGRQEVVGDAGGHLAEDVGRRRRDDDDVRGVGQTDVPDLGLLREAEGVRRHRVARQRLQRQRRDELLRARGHDDLHPRVSPDEQAHRLARLVAGDAAAQREHDRAFLEPHGHPPTARVSSTAASSSAARTSCRSDRSSRARKTPAEPHVDAHRHDPREHRVADARAPSARRRSRARARSRPARCRRTPAPAAGRRTPRR